MMTPPPPHQVAPGDRPAGNLRRTRSAAVGRHGMIATSQVLASAAGLHVLQRGGHAVDAAVTAAAVLAVVEPSMNGIGGDLFALVYDAGTRQVYGLDSCGRSGYRATPEEFERRGLSGIPGSGPLAVTVPGVVEGWHQLLARFGTMGLAVALQPAIGYAREGFPVQELMAADWALNQDKLAQDPAAAKTFLPGGRAPREAEVFANPNLARSLEHIATDGRDAFYTGGLAEAIVADIEARRGLLELRDFADHRADWVEPIHTSYRGHDVLEMPPSTQGFVALEMLNLMEGFDVGSMGHNSADYLHLVSEAKKIAFADRAACLADRDAMPKGALAALISKDYAAARRAEIDGRQAADYAPGSMGGRVRSLDFAGQDLGDTIYLTVADNHGNVVSFVQSLFGAFGAGIVAGDTGITLHNRGAGFTLTPGHPNRVGPHKRPLHTLVPAMILKDGRPWVSFGVMGGDNQAQAHAQLVANLVDFGMNIQQAGEAARIRHLGTSLALESGITSDVRAALEARGHETCEGRGLMGGFQGILIDQQSGVLMGGSDVRKDGLAIGW
ncbi:MAG TPA: gamma-glutamyltransferase [Vicinamibacterales bacterium]|nr:gamma-glutamyltransferase [Vicinamibacterales bacterium]